MSPSAFQSEQLKVSAVETKAGQKEKETGQKQNELLEAELKAKHDVFFKQVDSTQKVFDAAYKLKSESAKTEIGKDKQEIKKLLAEVATNGELLLKDKNPNLQTIRENSNRISKITASISDNLKFFQNIDSAQALVDNSDTWLKKAQGFENNLEKPIGWQKDYQLALDEGLACLGEHGAMAFLDGYTNISSPEYKAIYDKIKLAVESNTELLTASRLRFQTNFGEKFSTYIDEDGNTKEFTADQKDAVSKLQALRDGEGNGSKAEGYVAMNTLLKNAQIQIDNAKSEPDETKKQVFLESASSEYLRVKDSADAVVKGLSGIDAKILPPAFKTIHFSMESNCASAVKEADAKLKNIEKGNSTIDSNAVFMGLEKDYNEGQNSPKKKYESALAERDKLTKDPKFGDKINNYNLLASAIELKVDENKNDKNPDVLHESELLKCVDDGLTSLSKLNGKLETIDRSTLNRDEQTRYDLLKSNVKNQIQELSQIKLMFQSYHLASSIGDRYKEGEKKAHYFDFVTKEVKGQKVTAMIPTKEFTDLPKDKQQAIMREFEALPYALAIDLEIKKELPEDKELRDGMDYFQRGDWQNAKKILLSYYNKFQSNPDKGIQINSAHGLLQGIMQKELGDVKDRLLILGTEYEGGFTADNKSRPQMYGEISDAWKKFRTAETEVNSGSALTIEAVWDKVGKLPNFTKGGIDWMDQKSIQIMLNEPDPVKRKANILNLGKWANEAGLKSFSKMYYDMYFAERLEAKKKGINRTQVLAEYDKEDHSKEIESAIKAAHAQERTKFITYINQTRGFGTPSIDAANQKIFDQYDANYDAQDKSKIKESVTAGMREDAVNKAAKQALHQEMMGQDPSLDATGMSVTWQEAYGGRFNVVENIDNKFFVTELDVSSWATKWAIHFEALAAATAMGILTGGATAGFAAEAGLGAGVFGVGGINFIVDGFVMHSTLTALTEGNDGFKDPRAFGKGLLITYATMGLMKGTGSILGSSSKLARAEQFIGSAVEGSAVKTFVSTTAKLTGKSTLDAGLMTGFSAFTTTIEGKSLSAEDLKGTFADNLVTCFVMGGMHGAIEHSVVAEAPSTTGKKTTQSAETKVAASAEFNAWEASKLAEKAKAKADQAAEKTGKRDAKLDLAADTAQKEAKALDKDAAQKSKAAEPFNLLASTEKTLAVRKAELEKQTKKDPAAEKALQEDYAKLRESQSAEALKLAEQIKAEPAGSEKHTQLIAKKAYLDIEMGKVTPESEAIGADTLQAQLGLSPEKLAQLSDLRTQQRLEKYSQELGPDGALSKLKKDLQSQLKGTTDKAEIAKIETQLDAIKAKEIFVEFCREGERGNFETYPSKGIRDIAKMLGKAKIGFQMTDALSLARRKATKGDHMTPESAQALMDMRSTLSEPTIKEVTTEPGKFDKDMSDAESLGKQQKDLRKSVKDANPEDPAQMKDAIDKTKNAADRLLLEKAWEDLNNTTAKDGEGLLTPAEKKVIFDYSISYLADFKAYAASTGKTFSINEVFGLMQSNQRKLAHQAAFDKLKLVGSDHGATHLLEGNMKLAEKAMDDLNMSPQDRILVRQALIDHDMGYTMEGIRDKTASTNLFAFSADHPIYSALYVEGNRATYEKFFGKEGYDVIHSAVLDHSVVMTSRRSKLDGLDYQPDSKINGNAVRAIASMVDCLGTTADVKIGTIYTHPEIIGSMQKLRLLYDSYSEITPEGKRVISDTNKPKLQAEAQLIINEMSRMISDMPGVDAATKKVFIDSINQSLSAANFAFPVDGNMGMYGAKMNGIEVKGGKLTVNLSFDPQMAKAIADSYADKKAGQATSVAGIKKAMGDFGLENADTPGQREAAEICKKQLADLAAGKYPVGTVVEIITPKGVKFNIKVESIPEYSKARETFVRNNSLNKLRTEGISQLESLASGKVLENGVEKPIDKQEVASMLDASVTDATSQFKKLDITLSDGRTASQALLDVAAKVKKLKNGEVSDPKVIIAEIKATLDMIFKQGGTLDSNSAKERLQKSYNERLVKDLESKGVKTAKDITDIRLGNDGTVEVNSQKTNIKPSELSSLPTEISSTAIEKYNNSRLEDGKSKFPKNPESAYEVRENLPGGQVLAHNSTGELVIYKNVETLNLAKEKLSTKRLGQDAVEGKDTAEKVDKLRLQAELDRPLFDQATARVAQEIGAVELHNGSVGGPKGEGVPLKDKGQTEKKIDGPFGGNERFMTDVLRGTIVCKDIPSISKGIEALMRDPNVKQISVQNRISWEGCNDVLVNVKLKNGHVAELQFHVPEIKKAISPEGIMIPESKLSAQDYVFSSEDVSIVESLKLDQQGRRTLRKDIQLPVYKQPVSTHIVYEIMRSMPKPTERTPQQNALYQRLNDIMVIVHQEAMSQYTERTGLEFKPDFNL